MVSLDDAVIARIVKKNEKFEILVDPDLAIELKNGKNINIENMLAVFDIFKDARSGERASEDAIEHAFGKCDIYEIARKIVINGDVQITAEHRRKMIEKKKKEIANIISKQSIDPKTKLPHPVQRILNAMEKAKINIDPFKDAKEQVKNVLDSIVQILPISMEKVDIAIKVPIEFGGKVATLLRSIGSVKKEEWGTNYIALLEIPAGMQTELYNKLNSITHGNVQTKIIKEMKI